MISVLIPVYNTAEYLPECLDSVLGQTYTDLEIILCDDGSTDGSGRLCDEYALKDSRVRVLHQPNGGVAAARNALLREARGEYIAWADSDDVCAPGMLQYLCDGLMEYGADVAQCGMTLRPDNTGPRAGAARLITSRGELYAALVGNRVSHVITGKLFKAAVLSGMTFPPLGLGEDSYMAFASVERTEALVLLPGVFYYYRQRGDSITHLRKPADIIAAYDKILELPNPPDAIRIHLAYTQAHSTAVALALSPLEYGPNREIVDGFFRSLRGALARLLSSGVLGPLGVLELLVLCSGLPGSWRFGLWCQRIYEKRAERRTRCKLD